MSEEKVKQVKIDLNVPEDQRHGVYANHMFVQFTPTEFQIYFNYLAPPQEDKDRIDVDVVSKVNISIELMPAIIRTLEENYRKFLMTKEQISKGMDKEND